MDCSWATASEVSLGLDHTFSRSRDSHMGGVVAKTFLEFDTLATLAVLTPTRFLAHAGRTAMVAIHRLLEDEVNSCGTWGAEPVSGACGLRLGQRTLKIAKQCLRQ